MRFALQLHYYQSFWGLNNWIAHTESHFRFVVVPTINEAILLSLLGPVLWRSLHVIGPVYYWCGPKELVRLHLCPQNGTCFSFYPSWSPRWFSSYPRSWSGAGVGTWLVPEVCCVEDKYEGGKNHMNNMVSKVQIKGWTNSSFVVSSPGNSDLHRSELLSQQSSCVGLNRVQKTWFLTNA